MEIEKSLLGNKTMNKLTLTDDVGVILPKQFCRHLLLGIRRNSSLIDVNLSFYPQNWDCPDDGRLVTFVTQLDVVSVQCVTSNSEDVYICEIKYIYIYICVGVVLHV